MRKPRFKRVAAKRRKRIQHRHYLAKQAAAAVAKAAPRPFEGILAHAVGAAAKENFS
jgi:hypothetical protein